MEDLVVQESQQHHARKERRGFGKFISMIAVTMALLAMLAYAVTTAQPGKKAVEKVVSSGKQSNTAVPTKTTRNDVVGQQVEQVVDTGAIVGAASSKTVVGSLSVLLTVAVLASVAYTIYMLNSAVEDNQEILFEEAVCEKEDDVEVVVAEEEESDAWTFVAYLVAALVGAVLLFGGAVCAVNIYRHGMSGFVSQLKGKLMPTSPPTIIPASTNGSTTPETQASTDGSTALETQASTDDSTVTTPEQGAPTSTNGSATTPETPTKTSGSATTPETPTKTNGSATPPVPPTNTNGSAAATPEKDQHQPPKSPSTSPAKTTPPSTPKNQTPSSSSTIDGDTLEVPAPEPVTVPLEATPPPKTPPPPLPPFTKPLSHSNKGNTPKLSSNPPASQTSPSTASTPIEIVPQDPSELPKVVIEEPDEKESEVPIKLVTVPDVVLDAAAPDPQPQPVATTTTTTAKDPEPAPVIQSEEEARQERLEALYAEYSEAVNKSDFGRANNCAIDLKYKVKGGYYVLFPCDSDLLFICENLNYAYKKNRISSFYRYLIRTW